jgi:hypothetical protein
VIQQIIISTGAWFVPVCILAGVLYAAALYYRERRNEFSGLQRIIMGTIRALTVSLIAFFMLSPLFRSTKKKIEEPLIIVAQDQSASIATARDSVFYADTYPTLLNNLVDELGRDFDVHTFSFGDHIREDINFEFTDKQTNITDMLAEVQSRYLNRNVGALILASDGIFNQGVHPQYAMQYLPFPVYTVALGDTTPVKDAVVVNVAHNRIAFLDNTFPLEVHARGVLCNGMSSTLRVLKDGRVLFSERISFSGNNDNRFIPVELNAEQAGLQRYRVELLPVEGEIILSNNVKDIYIEVLESKQRVLVLYSSPHPDITAIRQTLEAQENYTVEVFEASQFNGNPKEFNLAVLHQIPSRQQAFTSLIRKLNDADLPILHILGSGSDLNVFSTLAYGLNISGSADRMDETLPVLNPAFNLFTLSDEFIETLRFFPPLFSPFGTYRESLASKALFHKQIGSLVTDAPLMTFTDVSGRKTGIIAGEGLWRWRLTNFSRRGNHIAFNEWLTKSIQYLALREQKDQFRIQTQNSWNENEEIEFSAELYNASFEPVNTPEIELVISDEEGNQYPFTFSRMRNAYSLKAGSLEPGNYTYSASTQWQNERLEARGAFSVLPLQVEFTNLVADHRLMNSVAERFGGEMFLAADLGQIANIIRERGDVKPVFYFEKSYLELIDLKYLLALLIALLTAEWIFRRIAGGY